MFCQLLFSYLSLSSHCNYYHELCPLVFVCSLDAPVSGGPAGAWNGTLSVMVGGDTSAVDTCRDILQLYSANIKHMGGVGE